MVSVLTARASGAELRGKGQRLARSGLCDGAAVACFAHPVYLQYV